MAMYKRHTRPPGADRAGKTTMTRAVLSGLAALVVCGAVRAQTDQAGTQPKPRVRIDGIYGVALHSNPGDPANPIYVYVRFYEDGTAIDVMSADKPDQVIQWLTKNNGTGNQGWHVLVENRLTFRRPTATGELTRSGVLVDDTWVLGADTAYPTKYTFFEVNAPEPGSPTGSNRIPLVKSQVAVENRIVLGPTGRKEGVTTTVTVDASDPDGDPLMFTWRSSNGSVAGSGNKVVWRNRPVYSYGAVQEGVLFLEVQDDKGGKTTRAWVMY